MVIVTNAAGADYSQSATTLKLFAYGVADLPRRHKTHVNIHAGLTGEQEVIGGGVAIQRVFAFNEFARWRRAKKKKENVNSLGPLTLVTAEIK